MSIQPRLDGSGRAFTPKESYFVADARNHPALAQPLVDATGARSALFEPVRREGGVCGVLIVVWQLAIGSVPEGAAGMLRLLAAQAAVAIEHAGLRARMETLSLTDQLTGVSSRRVFEDELPRELARARRAELPVSVGVIDLDHLGAFNMLRGEREGDRLLKEAAALWRGELREVDTLARLGGGTFGLILPNCGLADAVDVLDRVRGAHAARADRVRRRGPVGRRGAGRAAPGPLRAGAARGQAGRAQRHPPRGVTCQLLLLSGAGLASAAGHLPFGPAGGGYASTVGSHSRTAAAMAVTLPESVCVPGTGDDRPAAGRAAACRTGRARPGRRAWGRPRRRARPGGS